MQIVAVIAALVFGLLAWTPSAQASSCSVTGLSGGNPSGEDVYTCTGLFEGDELTINVNQTVGPDSLQATAVITVFEISAGVALLDIDLTNASGPGDANRITSFGLGIDPDATGESLIDIGGEDDTDAFTAFSQSNFPGFNNVVEFCATSGNNCAGGGSGGLESGQQDLFRFSLTNGFVEGGTIDLSQFVFQFQGGVDGASYQKPGTPDNGVAPPAQVPGPATFLLLGAGLLALGSVRAASRRR